MRRVPLPSEGLYPLRALAGALAIYGVATVARGSGFLAVFIAGVLIGDESAPCKGEIARFHSALASPAEIVAFAMLGLMIRLYALPHASAWLIGLALAGLRDPAAAAGRGDAVAGPAAGGERVFVLWAGLEGVVPILLGAFIVQAGIPDAPRIYEIIFVVVTFSVIVQGGTVPGLARRAKIPRAPSSQGPGAWASSSGKNSRACTGSPSAPGPPPWPRPTAIFRCPRPPGSVHHPRRPSHPRSRRRRAAGGR